MEIPSRLHILEKLPFKDVTNLTPTPARSKKSSRAKRSNSISATTTTTITTTIAANKNDNAATPQRRSTRLSSLRSETKENLEREDEPQSGITTRSRRKATPNGGGEGSATTQKRRGRREPREESVNIGRSHRRSISTMPSSPLAGKSSPQQALLTPNPIRVTRLASISARTESSETSRQKLLISVIDETEFAKSQGKLVLNHADFENMQAL